MSSELEPMEPKLTEEDELQHELTTAKKRPQERQRPQSEKRYRQQRPPQND